MPWSKLDDEFYDHPKVVEAGTAATGLFALALSYCARKLTDGFVPAAMIRRLCADVEDPLALANRLVAVGLFELAEGGYQVHDYLDYNPSAAKVIAERDAAKARMWGARHEEHPECSGDVQANTERTSVRVQVLPSPSPSPSPYPAPDPVPPPVPVGVVEPAQPARVDNTAPESTTTPTTGLLGLVHRTFDPGSLNAETPRVLEEAVREYGEGEVRQAIEMMDQQAPAKRGWPYVKAILRRWAEEGSPPATESPPGNGHVPVLKPWKAVPGNRLSQVEATP